MAEPELEDETSRPGLGPRLAGLAQDAAAGVLFLLGLRAPVYWPRMARGALVFPLAAAALGSLVAAVLDLLPADAPRALPATLGVLLLAGVGGGRFLFDFARFCGGGPLGVAALVVMLVGQGWGLMVLEGNLRDIALVLTPMLGMWAYVVQGYGSLPARPDGFAAVFVREMEFTQFATASVSAMAVSLILVNALGTMVLFAVASSTIVLRIVVHARRGGVSAVSLGAVCVIAETISLVLAGAVVRLVGN